MSGFLFGFSTLRRTGRWIDGTTWSGPRAFPLSTGDFFDRADVWTPRFEPMTYQSVSGLRGGGLIAAEFAAARWSADVTIAPYFNRDSVGLEAIINSLRGSIKSFEAYDTRRAFPYADPTGAILGAAAVTISAIGSDNASLKLAGLPAGYTITSGDYISVPSRKQLFQAIETSVANASGISPTFFAVTPSILPNLVNGDAVRLIKPIGFFRIVPGTYSAPVSDGATSRGGSFKMMQVFQ